MDNSEYPQCRQGNFWAPIHPDNSVERETCHQIQKMIARDTLSKIEKAEKLIREDKLTLATLDAKFEMAERYRWGLGVPTNPKKALELYKAAAEAGHANAARELARSYTNKTSPERLDICRNIPMAKQIVEKTLQAAESLDFDQSGEIEDLKIMRKVIDWYIKDPDFADL